jgi:hypothetical protein
MREHTVNSLDNFIGGWYLEDTSICDNLIQYHTSSEHFEGYVGVGFVNKDWKDSLDCNLLDEDLFSEYNKILQQVVNQYTNKYPYSSEFHPWSVTERINIQKYNPGGGFHGWHSERTTPVFPAATRHLVFMTYLNDVTDDGETEFWHQKLKVKPEKGLTLIWPSDWTFTHRGIVSNTQEKYIITGWFNYINK